MSFARYNRYIWYECLLGIKIYVWQTGQICLELVL
jgi:hypothetical protein